MEEDVMQEKVKNFQHELIPLRRELLTFRSYYDEIMDLGRALEENENGFFIKNTSNISERSATAPTA